jgi:hypothetical protein
VDTSLLKYFLKRLVKRAKRVGYWFITFLRHACPDLLTPYLFIMESVVDVLEGGEPATATCIRR